MDDTGRIEPKPVLGERFMPEPEEVMPMIKAAERRRLELKQGLKSGTEEKPLQEAIWLAEALMNYEKGDASRFGDDWISGVEVYSLPIHVKADASAWVSEENLYEAFEHLMEALNARFESDRVYAVDLEPVSLENGFALIRLEWHDVDGENELPGPWSPDGAGWPCMNPIQGARAIQTLIRRNFHGVRPPAGSIIVTYGGLQIYDAVTEVGYFGAYPYYLGTSTLLNGPFLMYSGADWPSAICFPLWWEKHLQLRTAVENQMNLPQHLSLVRERFDAVYIPRTGPPMTYGSPYYPMGPWDFMWTFWVGHVIEPIGPE